MLHCWRFFSPLTPSYTPLLIALATVSWQKTTCVIKTAYHCYTALYFPRWYTGMLSGLQVVLARQPSQVWLMPTPTLSYRDIPATGPKCTTTCRSWARPSRAPPAHLLTSYRQRGGRREELHSLRDFSKRQEPAASEHHQRDTSTHNGCIWSAGPSMNLSYNQIFVTELNI